MRARLAALIALATLLLLVPAVNASAASPLERYARATWASFAAMTDARTGLPTDRLRDDGTRSRQTSITDIGAYLWSAVAAGRLGIIGHGEEVARLSTTIG